MLRYFPKSTKSTLKIKRISSRRFKVGKIGEHGRLIKLKSYNSFGTKMIIGNLCSFHGGGGGGSIQTPLEEIGSSGQ